LNTLQNIYVTKLLVIYLVTY